MVENIFSKTKHILNAIRRTLAQLKNVGLPLLATLPSRLRVLDRLCVFGAKSLEKYCEG